MIVPVTPLFDLAVSEVTMTRAQGPALRLQHGEIVSGWEGTTCRVFQVSDGDVPNALKEN